MICNLQGLYRQLVPRSQRSYSYRVVVFIIYAKTCQGWVTSVSISTIVRKRCSATDLEWHKCVCLVLISSAVMVCTVHSEFPSVQASGERGSPGSPHSQPGSRAWAKGKQKHKHHQLPNCYNWIYSTQPPFSLSLSPSLSLSRCTPQLALFWGTNSQHCTIPLQSALW